MKIYVASSWRNDFHKGVVEFLKGCGHEVYDFKGPTHFSWKECLPDGHPEKGGHVRPGTMRKMLDHASAACGFLNDVGGLKSSQVCLLLMPCGLSAHMEFAWASAAGKETVVYFPEPDATFEPELMYLFASAGMLVGPAELAEWAER